MKSFFFRSLPFTLMLAISIPVAVFIARAGTVEGPAHSPPPAASMDVAF